MILADEKVDIDIRYIQSATHIIKKDRKYTQSIKTSRKQEAYQVMENAEEGLH